MNCIDAAEGGRDYLGVGVGLERGDEVEIVADGGLVGADLGPLVADETDALGGREAGFNLRDESRVICWAR